MITPFYTFYKPFKSKTHKFIKLIQSTSEVDTYIFS